MLIPKQQVALIIVDHQNDFVSGALAVPGARKIRDPISAIIDLFDTVIMTQDWHPDDHCSFEQHGGRWPQHCVAGKIGSEFAFAPFVDKAHMILRKGFRQDRDDYSAFFVDRGGSSPLEAFLVAQGISTVVVCGLATDFCVKATVVDAQRLGFHVIIVDDAIAGVDETETEKTLSYFAISHEYEQHADGICRGRALDNRLTPIDFVPSDQFAIHRTESLLIK